MQADPMTLNNAFNHGNIVAVAINTLNITGGSFNIMKGMSYKQNYLRGSRFLVHLSHLVDTLTFYLVLIIVLFLRAVVWNLGQREM